MKIAIAAYSKTIATNDSSAWIDDVKLAEALVKKGHVVEIIDWCDKNINWQQFDKVFVSTTWDASHKPFEFIDWLNNVEQDGKYRLVNQKKVIETGLLKSGYLDALKQKLDRNPCPTKGYVTPTMTFSTDDNAIKQHSFLTKLKLSEKDNLDKWLADNGFSHSIVIKPCISASGIETYVYQRHEEQIVIDDNIKKSSITSESEARKIILDIANQPKRLGVMI